MGKLNRREFIQASTAALLLENVHAFASNDSPTDTKDSSSVFVRTNTEGNIWTIGNTLVEREIRFDVKSGLHTTGWRHKITGTDFMEPARKRGFDGDEFSVRVDKHSVTGSNGSAWKFVEAKTQTLTPSGKLVAIHLRAVTTPIDVTVFYAVFDTHPVVQKWISITNRNAGPVTLSHLSFESVGIAPGLPNVLQASGFYGTEARVLLFTGRVDDAAVMVTNSLTEEGFIAMNGAPGWTKRTELMGWGDGVQLMYDTDMFPFERELQSGETFTSAKSSIAFFVDGHEFSDPRWVMPTYTSHILVKKGPGYRPPWIYNTWRPFTRSITRSITMDLIVAAGRMGMDVFTIDDGWQAEYGSNAINRGLFPNGLEEILAAVEEKGMRLGLWVPLAVNSTNIAVYREHPEWACRDQNGNPKFTSTASGSQAVMCLDSPYREVAATRISELIGRYHLRYVKMDLTTVFNTYGESPGCYAKGHFHRSWAASLVGIYESIQYVTDRIYRDHPDVLLDLTFELWGQKHVIDYGLLAAGDLDWLSNVDDGRPGSAGPRQARTLLYARSLAIPTETMLIGNLQPEMAPVDERLGTAMGSSPLFLGDLRKLTSEQLAWYGEKIQWFKALRKDISLQEGFFPLGNYQQPGAATWDGFARLSRQGEGMIVLFKNESQQDEVNLLLPVFPDGTFSLRSAINGSVLGTYTGKRLRQGIQIHFSPDHKVEILEIRTSKN